DVFTRDRPLRMPDQCCDRDLGETQIVRNAHKAVPQYVRRRSRTGYFGLRRPGVGLFSITPASTAYEKMPPSRPIVRIAVPRPPRTMVLPRSFSVFIVTRVLPAMTSFRLFMSGLVMSCTRR